MKTIPLPHGLNALVDDADFEKVSQIRWGILHSGKMIYAAFQQKKNGKGITVLMHRFILSAGKGCNVDHANGQTLDNRRENLRLCRQPQNVANSKRSRSNTSGFKGVSRFRNKWRAYIGSKDCGSWKHLGHFESAERAAAAYDTAAIEKYGDFALTNKRLGLLP